MSLRDFIFDAAQATLLCNERGGVEVRVLKADLRDFARELSFDLLEIIGKEECMKHFNLKESKNE
jgi:hypothetical protein